MSTLQVTTIRNPASSVANGTLNADGSTTFGGIVNFATGQTFPSASSTLPPASPTQGSTWYDTGVTPPVLKVWNGTAWVPVSSAPSGGTAPLNPSSGTTWFDTSVTPPLMKVWNGSAWVPVPSTATGTAPTSPTTGQQWVDTSTVPPVMRLWNGSAWIPATVAISNGVAPTTPVTGQLWSDTSTTPATLKAWNGSAWVPVQAAGGGGSGTVTAVSGTAPIAVANGTTTPVVSITAGTARQLLQTNAGGTAAEFASNIDVPGTLDVTGAAVFDNTVTVAGTHLQLNAQGDLRFADSDSSNYVAFQAPATVAANVTWTLPAADGTAGAVLSTNASGVTSWNDLGNGVALNGTAIKVSIGSASAPPTVGTPAANAMTGSMYWDDVAGAMFYRYDNGGTPVWVQASAGGGGAAASDWTRTGTVIAPTVTGDTVQFSAGTAALPGISFVGDADTGFFSSGAGAIDGSINGTNGIRFTNGTLQLSGTTALGANGAILLDGGGSQGVITSRNGVGGAVSLTAGSILGLLAANSTLNQIVISANSGSSGQTLVGAGAAWVVYSDERLKTKLEPITDGLSKVATLRAVTGELLVEEGVRHPFLIAQDVQAVLPEAVSKDAETDHLRLAYTEVIPLLVSALQDAKAEIDSLKARLDAAGV